MSRPITAGEAGSGADPVREVLRDIFLLLGAIGASLMLVTLLSLLLPGQPQPTLPSAAMPAQPLAQHQVVAGIGRKVPAWREAAPGEEGGTIPGARGAQDCGADPSYSNSRVGGAQQ